MGETYNKVCLCESCGSEHQGVYASGRFCNSACAHSYITKSNREEVSQKVSRTLSGRVLSPEHIDHIKIRVREQRLRELMGLDFEKLCLSSKRKRVFLEQHGCCLLCGISEWLGKSIELELDHKDGNTTNNQRSNLRGLCPNCHSQTETYCGRNRKGNQDPKVGLNELKAALQKTHTIGAALSLLGLSRSRNNYKKSTMLLAQLKSSGEAGLRPVLPKKRHYKSSKDFRLVVVEKLGLKKEIHQNQVSAYGKFGWNLVSFVAGSSK